MTASGARVPAPRATTAVAVGLVWAVAALASRRYGMWLAVGTTSVALGVVTLALEGPTMHPLLTPRLRPLLAGVLVGVVMTAMTYLMYPALVSVVPALAHDRDILYRRFYAAPGSWRRLALLPILVGEELVWRGLVQSVLVHRRGVVTGVVASAALYAAVQFPAGSPLLVLAALACGLVWGSLRAATGGLWAPFLAHAIWDVIILFIAPVAAG